MDERVILKTSDEKICQEEGLKSRLLKLITKSRFLLGENYKSFETVAEWKGAILGSIDRKRGLMDRVRQLVQQTEPDFTGPLSFRHHDSPRTEAQTVFDALQLAVFDLQEMMELINNLSHDATDRYDAFLQRLDSDFRA